MIQSYLVYVLLIVQPFHWVKNRPKSERQAVSSLDTHKNEHFSKIQRKKFWHALWEKRFYVICQWWHNYLRFGLSSWKGGFQLHSSINSALAGWITMKNGIQMRNKLWILQVFLEFCWSFATFYFSCIAFVLLLLLNIWSEANSQVKQRSFRNYLF